MSDDKPATDERQQFALMKALRAIDGKPFWWKEKIGQIETDFTSHNVDRKKTSLNMIHVIELINNSRADAAIATDPDTRNQLESHYDSAVKEVFEAAERLRLPLAREMNRRASADTSKGIPR